MRDTLLGTWEVAVRIVALVSLGVFAVFLIVGTYWAQALGWLRGWRAP